MLNLDKKLSAINTKFDKTEIFDWQKFCREIRFAKICFHPYLQPI
jgi:hypothetical protein